MKNAGDFCDCVALTGKVSGATFWIARLTRHMTWLTSVSSYFRPPV
jgi:hypothetical protein